MSLINIKQKLIVAAVTAATLLNPLTFPSSQARIWWDSMGENDPDYQRFLNTDSIIARGVLPALHVASPICKTYCYFIFPLMFVINVILMATSKEDKALGMCKTALISEIIVLLLMILLPQLLVAGIEAGGTSF